MEDKKIYPCIKCTEDEFVHQIKDKLEEFGYIINKYAIYDFDGYPILQTYYSDSENEVGNYNQFDRVGQYLCKSIDEFLEATKALAIERGWFKE